MINRHSLWTGAAAVVLVFGVVMLSLENMLFGLLIVGVVWLIIPARPEATPKWITILLAAIIFGSLLPTSVSVLFQGLALLVGYLAWLAAPAAERRAPGVVLWATLAVGYWALLIFHANVPSLDTGLLGFRKTVFCLAGLVLGVAVARQYIRSVERTLIGLLCVAVAVSIALFLYFPGLESSLVERNADGYTALLGGVSRLQGIFAGPFHAAVAGLVLVVWGIARFSSQRAFAAITIAVGGAAVYLSLVRTAYVALAVAVGLMVLASPTAGKAVRRATGIGLAAIIGVVALSSVSREALAIVGSIAEFGSDTRFLGRFPGYAEGLALFAQSPIFGWGAGSAGDTLGPAFITGEHVTSHNVILKIAVEGGLIGLVLWVTLIIAIVRRLPRGSQYTPAAIGMLGVSLGMGLTGSSIETLPPSLLIFMYVGLALDPRRGAAGSEKLKSVTRGAAAQQI
ncbi:O-antigen ligase family protein [Microbacterium sp. zg.Y909]|uniref:O-antigen ligase family protein n=1 Tax=Microbacterium sp. zg.Y909 TaxID=2969413 RepID=UPI00214B3DAD|nr:O-antigen ligase family protein [Microbacterium sp. zg.Y909]MCR2823953.1 O-antigen ligase family protein [Microbacterium sp. zg.Y909]